MTGWALAGTVLGWLVAVIVIILSIAICTAIIGLLVLVFVSLGQQARDAIRKKLAGKPDAKITALPKREEQA